MNIMSKLWLQASSFSTTTPGTIRDIPISKIKQSKNIRHIADTEELAKSIRQKGLLQPILVRTLDGFFEIVVGNRRFCACKALGCDTPRLRHRDLLLDNNKEDHGHLHRFLEQMTNHEQLESLIYLSVVTIILQIRKSAA